MATSEGGARWRGHFTMPDALHAVSLAHPVTAYSLLMKCAAATLTELAADPERLGARIWPIAVLHTWTQTLRFNLHMHCTAPGGGPTLDGLRWGGAREEAYLLPVRVLSVVFRGKLLSALEHAGGGGRRRWLAAIAAHSRARPAVATRADGAPRTSPTPSTSASRADPGTHQSA